MSHRLAHRHTFTRVHRYIIHIIVRLCVCVYNVGNSSRCVRGDNRSGWVSSRADLLLLLHIIIIFFFFIADQLDVIADDDAVGNDGGAVWSKKLGLKKYYCDYTLKHSPHLARRRRHWNLWVRAHTHYVIYIDWRENIIIYFYKTQIRILLYYGMEKKKTAGVLSRSHGLCARIVYLTTMRKKKK